MLCHTRDRHLAFLRREVREGLHQQLVYHIPNVVLLFLDSAFFYAQCAERPSLKRLGISFNSITVYMSCHCGNMALKHTTRSAKPVKSWSTGNGGINRRPSCSLHLIHDWYESSSVQQRRIDQTKASPAMRSPSRARKLQHRQGVSFRPHPEGPQQPQVPGDTQSPPTGLDPLQSGEVFAPPRPEAEHNTRRAARKRTRCHCLLSCCAVSSSRNVEYWRTKFNGGLVLAFRKLVCRRSACRISGIRYVRLRLSSFNPHAVSNPSPVRRPSPPLTQDLLVELCFRHSLPRKSLRLHPSLPYPCGSSTNHGKASESTNRAGAGQSQSRTTLCVIMSGKNCSGASSLCR